MKKYTIGVDFGTLSVRALLVSTDDGREIATEEFVYPHGILTEKEICGGFPSEATALQHPADYEQGLAFVINGVLQKSGVNKNEVAGIGIDFTSCTVFPVYADGTPLCYDQEFVFNPHAYAKLWKHHGAEDCAEDMTRIAINRGETWINDYGGSISSEELLPKALEVYRRAPEVYQKTAYFVEGADWITWKLTGKLVRSACFVGFKALWDPHRGYPKEYLTEVEPSFHDFYETKLQGEILPTGTFAGGVCKDSAIKYGLAEGTAVAVPVIDAHAAMPSAGVTTSGKLLVILGTSGVQLLLDKNDYPVQGICGKVNGGVVPEYYVYEAGQTSVGDGFDWMIKHCVPQNYYDEASRRRISIFDYLNELAEKDSGNLIAVDWWNGNRNPYNDYDLKGTIVGLTLQTKPEHIYYAFLQATTFGARKIMDLFTDCGVQIDSVVAGGGIANKNPLLMQMMANTLGKPVDVVDCKQAGAKGSAIFAAAASGVHATLDEATTAMADKPNKRYVPQESEVEKVEAKYQKYCALCDFFSQNKDLMKG